MNEDARPIEGKQLTIYTTIHNLVMMGNRCLLHLLLVIVVQQAATSFKHGPLRYVRGTPLSHYSLSSYPSSSSSTLKVFPTEILSSASLHLAGGLDAETLDALGDVQELNEALDSAVDSSEIVVNGLQKLVASPLVLAIPIGAGLLVAVGLGFFISNWGSGRDVQVDGDGTR